MRALIRWIVDHPLVTILGLAIGGLMGAYGAGHMSVDIFPRLNIPVVNIITHDPGAAPQDVELLISRPIGDQMRGITGVQQVRSTSFVGISVVTVQFNWNTSVQQARQLVTARLARVRAVLPQGAAPRIESIGTALQQVVGYVVYSGADPVTIRRTVRYNLASRLMDVNGVSRVEILGGDRRAFVVRFRPDRLASLNLSVSGVVRLLRANNRAEVAGYLSRSSQEYLIRGDARLMTVKDIESLPLERAAGKTVLLGQVARVNDWRAPRHYSVLGNGVPAVAFYVLKQPGASTLQVAKKANRLISNLHGLFPPGTQIRKFYDQSEMIGQAREEILRDLLFGALLAVLVLFFFMGTFRPTLVVAATIPLTLLTTLAVMRVSGQGLNMITMSALVLGIGMFVDDAIVVSENIFRHRQLGKAPAAAALDGAVEIAGPDASGTFTTVAAYLPLILVTGLAGVFLRPFGLTISAGLLASLLISLTFIPLAFSRLKTAGPSKSFAGSRVLAWMDRRLQNILSWSLSHRRTILAAAAAGLAAGGAAAFFVGRPNLLPPIDEGSILIEYRMPHGTSLPEMDRIGRSLESIALRNPDVTTVYLRVGGPRGSLVVDPMNRGELMIKLAPLSRRRHRVGQIMGWLRRRYSDFQGVIFLYHQPTQENMDESFSGLPAFFGVTLFGPKLPVLTRFAAKVQGILQKDPAVSGVVNETLYPVPALVVRVNNAALGQYGVTASEVLDTIRAARLGVQATQVIRQREIIPVLVDLDLGKGYDPHSIAALRQIPVRSASGWVPLGKVATVKIEQTPAALTRLNGQREVTLITDVTGSIGGLVSRLNRKFAGLGLPEGYSIGYSGQYKVMVKTGWELGYAFLTALILIYLIMVLQFHSWLEPLVIILAVPFSLVGAAAALALAGLGPDVSVGMGILTLAGISVNNAIVLMEYANREGRRGLARREALLSGASVRLRPILMTAMTTILALAPAAVVLGTGSKVFQPFAVTVLGGLVTATVGTLVVVPVLGSYLAPRKPQS